MLIGVVVLNETDKKNVYENKVVYSENGGTNKILV